MDYIRKLPLLMGLTSAIVAGIAGYVQKVSNKENMLKMLIVMIIFFFTGSLIKNTINNVLAALVKKAEEKSKKLRQLEKEKNKESDAKRNSNEKGRFLDIKTNDEFDANTDEEEFNALPVADFIKKELK